MADDTAEPDQWLRVVSYETSHTTGQVRYTIKAVPEATLIEQGQASPSSHRLLDIHIIERAKP